MDIAHFERSLVSGRGDIVLHLQTHDATPYRDAILRACLHNVAYETQGNSDRADFLYDLVQLAGESQFFREHILAALPITEGHYDKDQLYELARRFAAQGDDEARHAMYAAFTDQVPVRPIPGAVGFREIVTEGMEAIIALDGIAGFLFIADALGAWVQSDDDASPTDWPYTIIQDQVPRAELTPLLERAATENSRIAAYFNAIKADAEESKQDGRRIRAERNKVPSYKDLEQSIATAEDFWSHMSSLQRWGQNAGEDDVRRAAQAFLEEQDPVRQMAYAKFSGGNPFHSTLPNSLQWRRAKTTTSHVLRRMPSGA